MNTEFIATGVRKLFATQKSKVPEKSTEDKILHPFWGLYWEGEQLFGWIFFNKIRITLGQGHHWQDFPLYFAVNFCKYSAKCLYLVWWLNFGSWILFCFVLFLLWQGPALNNMQNRTIDDDRKHCNNKKFNIDSNVFEF